MMSALSDMGHPTKKKPAATYGKTPVKSRLQASTLPTSASSTSMSSKRVADTTARAKDVYDYYDFPEDDDFGPQITAKPRPFAAPKTPAKPLSTISAANLATAVTSARGVKRKPSQPEAAKPIVADSINVQVKRKQVPASIHSSPSLAPALAPSPVFSRRAPSLVSSSSGLSGLSTLSATQPKKTPPRETPAMTPKSVAGSRALHMSPSKPRAVAIATATSSQKQPPPAITQSPHSTPSRRAPGSQVTLQSRPSLPRSPSQKTTPMVQRTSQTPQPATKKRRRLIDALVDQLEEDSEEEGTPRGNGRPGEGGGGSDEEDGSQSDTLVSRHRNVGNTPLSDGYGHQMDLDSLATLSPGKASIAPSTPAMLSRRIAARRPGVKFTYNLERTMLAEEPVMLGGPSGSSDLSLLQSFLPDPEPAANAFNMDDDDGDAAGATSQTAIQSIHELRQAGANSREADELVDILDRIGTPSSGKPSSARRTALLELVQKLQEKPFLRQFRDHSAETRVFREIGKETDPIAGFAMCCVVILLLANASATSRLLRELQQQKISRLFATLLSGDVDIVTVARDRKTNVSNHSRQTLATIKAAMQKLAVWKPAPAGPTQLSPRTVALKALHMYAKQAQEMQGDAEAVFFTALGKELFGIVSSTLPSACDDEEGIDEATTPPLISTALSSDADVADLYLSLSLLEVYSVTAMQSDIGAEWTRHYVPIIAEALEASLQERQAHGKLLNESELKVLSLALNTANNNPEAARYYVDKGLLQRLADVSCKALLAVSRSVKSGEEFPSDALKELLLMLGVMINFTENDSSAGESLVQDDGGALVDDLGRAFLSGHSLTAEADSEEKSQLNVAYAYLSILLGYLCLHDSIYQAFKELSPKRNPKPLLDSIHQFITFHDQVGKTSGDASNGAEANFSARLRALAHDLEMKSY